jgi:hypothetical protein
MLDALWLKRLFIKTTKCHVTTRKIAEPVDHSPSVGKLALARLAIKGNRNNEHVIQVIYTLPGGDLDGSFPQLPRPPETPRKQTQPSRVYI